MQTKLEGWRGRLGGALGGTSPVGARLIGSLGSLVSGEQAAETALAGFAARGGAVAGATDPDSILRQLHGWHAGLDDSIRRPARVGIAMLIVFVFGLGLWATTAPLSSAVVARGSFVATGQNKIVQHLEGGIIRKLLVNEGDAVQADQPLIELDDTSSNAEKRRLEIKQASLLATKARLDAEREGAEHIVYPPELTAVMSDEEVAKSVRAQEALFQSRREEFNAIREINERQIAAIEEEIEGLKAQKASSDEQLNLIVEETATAQKLYGKGLTELSRLLDLKRTKSKIEGDIGQFQSAIGKAEQRILETKTDLIHQRTKLIEDGADLYRATTADLSDTEERLTAAKNILARHIIRAPVRGVIVKMQYHTAGGVIPPSQPILEILPTDEKLLVEAMVRPEEIDFIHVGEEAELRLTALNQRTTPMVQGKVIYVSADKIQNQGQTSRLPGQDYYYLVRVELDDQSVKDRVGTVKLAPGMPAEVYVKTGYRTMWEYLTKPIVDVMHHGGREK